MVRSAVLALVAILLVGCGLGSDPVINGWPIGSGTDCGRRDDCDELVMVGLAHLDRRDPDHAAVATAELHDEGVLVDPSTGNVILVERSGGGCNVLVVTLIDATKHAIGVCYPGISTTPMAFDHGPRLRQRGGRRRLPTMTLTA
jgi:hypothetical protein